MKKTALFAILACAAVLAGAQTPKAEWLSKGQFPLTKNKVTFTMLMPTVPEVIDIKTNWFTKWYEAKTNVAIDWVMAPNEADAQKLKLNLLIAAGDLPEIINTMPIDAAMEARFGADEKIFLPLNKYIDDPKIMPNFNAWLAKNPVARGLITGVDGNIYGFPSIAVCYHCSLQQKMWINSVWLKKLGLKEPTTTEEFYQVLKAFKEKDPNGNGKADEIPLLGATDSWNSQVEPFLMSSFILDPGMYQKMKLLVDNKSGKILTSLNQDGYREGLKYIARLFREGLYYPGSITQKMDQAKQLLAMDPQVVGAFPGGYMGIGIDPVAQNATWRSYTIVVPLKGPNGYASTPDFVNDGLQTNKVVFTKALKNPELAARWVDAFYSYEIALMESWGEMGSKWRWAKPGELGMDGKPAIWKGLVSYTSEPQNDSWKMLGISKTTAEIRNGQETAPGVDPYAPEGLETMLLQVSKKMEPFIRTNVSIMPKVKFTTAESEELQMLQVELERYSESQRIVFETGAEDIDKGWKAYVQKLNELGLAKYIAIQQKAYDRQYKTK